MPGIFLADQPTFVPFTAEEFDKIPIQAAGKILKNQTDWEAYADIARAAIQGYRNYIASLFDKDAPPEVSPGVPTAPIKKGWGFWK